jgi:hypothetical protein
MTKNNLALVRPDKAATSEILSPNPPQPTVPVLSRSSVFIDSVRVQLKETESDIGIVDAQIVAENDRFAAAVEAETLKHEATTRALEWQRDDLLGVSDMCRAALGKAGGNGHD